MFDQITIIGCGLIGSSIFKGLKKKSSIKKCCPEANSKIDNNNDWLNLTSGYIKRSKDIFPKQGKRSPWTNNQNFLKDIFQIRYGKINDGEIKFS